MSKAVEDAYHWKSDRGLEIVKTAILAIEYDEDTKKLLSDVKKADALSGARGNSFMQQSLARGMQSAGETGGGSGMAFMGMGMNVAGGMMQGMNQPQQATTNPFINVAPQQAQQAPTVPQETVQPSASTPAQEDPYTKLTEMKKLLDAGVITQADFDAVKAKLLGI